MGLIINTIESVNINIAPQTVEEEVLQNLWFLYSTIEYEIPLDRGFGMNITYVDKPIKAAKALAIADIYEKTKQYEPRAEIVEVSFQSDYESGILKPIVEVKINNEYDEEYTE